MTNKLTDDRSLLREAAKNYQTALAWYQSNIDSPAALDTWDAATAQFIRAIGHRETDIIADLFDEIAELQERRKADRAEPVADVVAWYKKGEKRICDIRWRRFDVEPGPLYTRPQSAPVMPDGWITYYPDVGDREGRAHSISGAESCAKRIAEEIGGYATPITYGETWYPENTRQQEER